MPRSQVAMDMKSRACSFRLLRCPVLCSQPDFGDFILTTEEWRHRLTCGPNPNCCLVWILTPLLSISKWSRSRNLKAARNKKKSQKERNLFSNLATLKFSCLKLFSILDKSRLNKIASIWPVWGVPLYIFLITHLFVSRVPYSAPDFLNTLCTIFGGIKMRKIQNANDTQFYTTS